jgi:hypothetical protein
MNVNFARPETALDQGIELFRGCVRALTRM